MGFKDIVQNDLKQVFMNQEEFADTHTWADGKSVNTITAVVDDDSLMEKYSSEFELLAKGSHCVMTLATQFSKKPQIASVIRFDGELFTIDEIQEQMGMYVIFLSKGKV